MRLRKLQRDDEQLFRKEKSRLMAFTPAATFYGYRNIDKIKSLSGILVLDFDNLADVVKAKNKVILDPHTLACFISPSGMGIKILVKTYSNPNADYISSYRAASMHYRRLLKVPFDKADDITRLCFLSHDPDLFWNPNSLEITYKIKIYSYNEITKDIRRVEENDEFDQFW